MPPIAFNAADRISDDGFATNALTLAIALTLAATTVLIAGLGLAFPATDALQPLAIVAGLVVCSGFYRRRGVANFVATLEALAALVGFSTIYSVLMYAIAATNRPWFDPWLARCDAALGFSAPAVVAWVQARPLLQLALEIAYFSIIPQTALAIITLGLGGQRAALERFLLRFIAAAGLTAVVFYLAPAQGTCSHYGFEVPGHYRQILVDLDAMRSGGRTIVTWRDAEGLITCPSFHTTWGVLLVMAFWSNRWLRWPILAINTVMIASTVPIGMHYLTDVLGGGAVVAVVVAGETFVAAARARRARRQPGSWLAIGRKTARSGRTLPQGSLAAGVATSSDMAAAAATLSDTSAPCPRI